MKKKFIAFALVDTYNTRKKPDNIYTRKKYAEENCADFEVVVRVKCEIIDKP